MGESHCRLFQFLCLFGTPHHGVKSSSCIPILFDQQDLLRSLVPSMSLVCIFAWPSYGLPDLFQLFCCHMGHSTMYTYTKKHVYILTQFITHSQFSRNSLSFQICFRTEKKPRQIKRSETLQLLFDCHNKGLSKEIINKNFNTYILDPISL